MNANFIFLLRFSRLPSSPSSLEDFKQALNKQNAAVLIPIPERMDAQEIQNYPLCVLHILRGVSACDILKYQQGHPAVFKPYSGEESRARTEQSFLVPKGEIVENGCDLLINKYKKTSMCPWSTRLPARFSPGSEHWRGWYDGKIFRPVSGCNKRRL